MLKWFLLLMLCSCGALLAVQQPKLEVPEFILECVLLDDTITSRTLIAATFTYKDKKKYKSCLIKFQGREITYEQSNQDTTRELPSSYNEKLEEFGKVWEDERQEEVSESNEGNL